MAKLSDAATRLLTRAADHEQHIAHSRGCSLPRAARDAVFRSLVKNNMLIEINAPRDFIGLGWRQDDDGAWIVARITDEGLRAIGIDPNEPDAEQPEPDCSGIEGSVPDAIGEDLAAMAEQQCAERGLQDQEEPHVAHMVEEEALLDEALAIGAKVRAVRADASSILDALREMVIAAEGAGWDIDPDYAPGLQAARDALAIGTKRTTRQPGAPRAGTKQDVVLTMLRRTEGATVAQIEEATGWANNTVRGFFAGLKKKGHAIEVLDRVRQVGPNKTGAKGSYTVYRIAG